METVIMLLNNSLPKNWVISCIGDVYRVLESGSRPSGGVKAFSEGTPSIGAEHINNWGGFNFTHLRYVPDEFASTVRRGKIELEDILIVKDGATTGRVAFVNKDFPYLSAILNEHVFRLRVNTEIINQKLLFYYLYSQVGQKMILSSFHGAAQGGINQQFIKSVFIPHPVSEKDQLVLLLRIETLLHQLTEARRLHEKIVADTNRLMESVLAEMLPNPEKGLPEGWGALPLSQLASEESNQIIPSDHPSDTFNYWGLDAISEGQIAEPPSNYIQGSEVKSTCISFTPKDVLYSKLRPYLNKVIVPTVDGIGSTEWVVYRPNPKLIRREYLAFVMRTKWFVSLASGTSYGARMPRANKSVLREIKIPIPLITDPGQSLSIQEQIVERISQFSSDVDSMQKGNAQQQRLLVQLEQSILAQAFRGEL